MGSESSLKGTYNLDISYDRTSDYRNYPKLRKIDNALNNTIAKDPSIGEFISMDDMQAIGSFYGDRHESNRSKTPLKPLRSGKG
mmetsp:Transcript_1847/g.1741  ORF Transcript_1847/g.1741 Transcript_1847/m.1741 type:complete len:84 (+) Transcript_1847:271-522(+)